MRMMGSHKQLICEHIPIYVGDYADGDGENFSMYSLISRSGRGRKNLHGFPVYTCSPIYTDRLVVMGYGT